MENLLSPCFQRTLLPLLLGGREERSHCGGTRGVGALSSTSLPSPSPPTCPAPCLTPGPDGTTAGPHKVLPHLEIFVLSIAATIYKGLAEPGLGVVEVPDDFGLAGTRVWRLQAEDSCRAAGMGGPLGQIGGWSSPLALQGQQLKPPVCLQ